MTSGVRGSKKGPGFNPKEVGAGQSVSVFEEHSLPDPYGSLTTIFNYVEEKAKSVGKRVPANRGTPRGADGSQFLSKHEKALCYLMRALGIPVREIIDNLNNRRRKSRKPLITGEYDRFWRQTGRHKEIIGAIQGDVLGALEKYAPLVSGIQRIVFRAKLLEFYRRELIKETELEDGEEMTPERVARIQGLDRSLTIHANFFDKMGTTSDLSSLLANPADVLREQQQSQAEADVAKRHADGEITDLERIEELRRLRHGDD